LIDLDHFKLVNDRYGHLVGDEALRRSAVLLRKLSRASDRCGRYGGEELVVVAPDTDLGGARVLAERIRAAISEEIIISPQSAVTFTASIGVTVFGSGDATPEDLLRRADRALYQAKTAGRNRVEYVVPGIPIPKTESDHPLGNTRLGDISPYPEREHPQL
jgi:diguanylate cyclase (GGDEF)-like protein